MIGAVIGTVSGAISYSLGYEDAIKETLEQNFSEIVLPALYAANPTAVSEFMGDTLVGGTEYNDVLYTSSNPATVLGRESLDVIRTRSYDDEIYAGDGSDTIYADGGADTVFGGRDRDVIWGEDGNDTIDGGNNAPFPPDPDSVVDTAAYSRNHDYYHVEQIGTSTYLITALTGQEGTDTLIGIANLRFADGTMSIRRWLTMGNGTDAPVEPTPGEEPPPPPGPTTNPLLSVTPVNQTLRVGESVSLSSIFPQSGWVDSDGQTDIRWVYVQDRSSGGGYLTNNGVEVIANTIHTIAVADLANWRFVAGNGPGTDEISFNIVQADNDYSPRLNPGAIMTTIPANTVVPPVDDHSDIRQSATVLSSSAISGYVSTNGTIGSSGDQDWFSVELQARRTYSFMLWPNSTTNSFLVPRLVVRLPDGSTPPSGGQINTALMSFVSISATVSGTYHLRAEGVNGTVGDYILTASPLGADPTAGGLTDGSGSPDPDPNNPDWDWEGTANDDRPSDLTLESGGRPQTTADNFYRGHNGDDRIYADAGDDVVWGDVGEDSLYGEDGRDTLRGGNGDDRLYGGDHDDLLYGEDGDDYMSGGNGDDTLYGGDEDDTLRGSDGDDYIKGEDDNDDIDGGDGDDQLYGDRGDDIVEGGVGNDFMMGGRGNDIMDGDAGHDRLAGEDDEDSLFGDHGDDHIYGGDENDILMGGGGNDLLHGEDGIDTADFSDGDDGVGVNLFNQIAISTDLGTDRLYEIENVVGSNGNDVVDGDHGINVLSGLDGNDNIRGHDGDDTLIGGDDNDTLWGDTGNDLVVGDADDDELRGGLGSDSLQGGTGNDHLRGEQENDLIDGGDGMDTAFFWGEREDYSITASGAGFLVTDLRADGLEGQDVVANVEFFEFFDGTVGADVVLQGPPTANADDADTSAQTPVVIDVLGNDVAGAFDLELISVEVQSGGGVAYVAGNQLVFDPRGEFDHLAVGTSSVVTLSYVVRSSSLLSSTATVQIAVHSNRDNFVGDRSDNEFYGYDGNDTLNGGDGNDLLFAGAGNDLLAGGAGNDLTDGGDGLDRVYFNGIPAATVDLRLTTAQNTGHGIDTIRNVENITSSSGNNRLTGNALGNAMVSGDGNDTLNGGDGNDLLFAGAGNDLLAGGAGLDAFVFNSSLGPGNVDRVTDYNVVEDMFRLDDVVFVGLATGILAASAFAANMTGHASDSLQRIIFEADTGNLYFDHDGSGTGARVHFATLSANLALTNTDLFVY